VLQRLGRQEDALTIWRRVANRRDNRQLYPLLEIAKHYERVTRDYEAARAACERALALVELYHARLGYARSDTDRDALRARIARLDARLARGRDKAARPPRSGRGRLDGAGSVAGKPYDDASEPARLPSP
jgi:hypothetical protein